MKKIVYFPLTFSIPLILNYVLLGAFIPRFPIFEYVGMGLYVLIFLYFYSKKNKYAMYGSGLGFLLYLFIYIVNP